MQQIKRKGKRINRKSTTKALQEQLLNAIDKNGMYPIHIAIKNNDLGTLEDLIDQGANLNKYNCNKDTPILLAIKENNLQIVEKLLEEGVDLNKTDANQDSPLEVATKLEHQECIDLLAEYGTSQNKPLNKKEFSSDNSVIFVNSLIELLENKIGYSANATTSQEVTKQILLLLSQYLNVSKIPSAINTKLHKEINEKISLFINTSHSNTQATKKALLNLARKIIVSILDYKRNLCTDTEWNLNKIESLIEEKIVNSNVESEKLSAYVFVSNNSPKEKNSKTIRKTDENWYLRNGYENFDEFIKINNLGAGSLKFLKFSTIDKENILQKTSGHGTDTLEMITIKPLHSIKQETFELLITDALKRIKEEQNLLKYNSDEWDSFNNLLSKAKKGEELSLNENMKLDKVLRPGKRHKIHVVHFHYNDEYEPFWDDFTKEAFLTGAIMHLFNPPNLNSAKTNLIYSGIAIVNNLLDQDIHPDKIILQSYGNGYPIAREVKNQFQKRGINLTGINYQPPAFSSEVCSEHICDHRNLNICFNKTYNSEEKIMKSNTPHEFSKFAKYISENLKQSNPDIKYPYLTAAFSKDYSMTQLINIFITMTQYFLNKYARYKNPSLPQERVENILGVVNV